MSSPPIPAADGRTPAARWPLAAALVVALIGFQLVYGLRLVGAGDAYWSNPHGDMGQMLAGELAGLRAPWSLPILTPDTLIAPDRVSLVYTDSIPWLTALLKLLHLGRTFSLLGSFLLLSCLAQPAAMYALLRVSGVRRWTTLLAGSLLALLVPAWLGRQIGHIALSGHAIQILALALCVQVIRHGLTRWRAAGFAALGVLAVGVHAYHVPPVTLMLAASLASEVLQRREGAARRAAWAGGAYLAAVLAAAWIVGYFVGRGGSGGVAALGLYEMNLIAPFLPQGSALAGQKWTGGWFTHSFDPTGGQVYEGYNYLGAGVLLVLFCAALLLWREHRPRSAKVSWRKASSAGRDAEATDPSWARRWGPLAAALGLLATYALGTKPYLGTIHLLTVPLPNRPWMEPLALFRCHGRFFWTVGYALTAGGLVVLDRAAGARLRAGVLLAAVLLQAADMSQMLVGLRSQFSRPDALHVPAALRGAAFARRDVRIYPGFFCTGSYPNQRAARQLSIIAQRQGASINSAETAREPAGACTRPPPADALRDAAPGDRRLTVLMGDDGASSAVTTLFGGRSDCFSTSGIWICGRDLAGTPGLTPVAGTQLIRATRPDLALALGTPAFDAALASGWSRPEPSGVWSDGRRAVLRLPRPDRLAGGWLTVSLEGLGYQPGDRAPQRAYASVAGRRLATWSLEGGGYRSLQVSAPVELLPPGRPVEVVIDLPDALSPNAALPGSGDPRVLGLGLRRITLAH